jgi:hypothetical protein
MAWNPVFPTAATIISQSVTGFQGNWSYIETTMQRDHFWDDSNPNYDGRHNVVQMPSQAVNPAIGTDMRMAFYCATASAQDVPHFRNSDAVYQIPFGKTGNTPLPASTSPITIVDFTGEAASYGYFMMFDTTISGRFATCWYKWRGGSLTIAFAQVVGSSWTSLQVDGGGTAIQLVNTSTNLRNAAWQYTGYGVS